MRCKGGQAPPSGTPPLVWDIGGACGASLRVWGNGRRTREEGLTRSCGAHSYPPRPSSPSPPVQGGAGPPFRNPPSRLGHWGRLRRIPSGLGATSGVKGRRTQSLVRSTFLPAASLFLHLPGGGGLGRRPGRCSS